MLGKKFCKCGDFSLAKNSCGNKWNKKFIINEIHFIHIYISAIFIYIYFIYFYIENVVPVVDTGLQPMYLLGFGVNKPVNKNGTKDGNKERCCRR